MKSNLRVIAGFPTGRAGAWLLVATAGFLLAALVNQSMFLVAATLAVMACLAVMLRWPEAGTLVVLFAIYSNIGVLAMRSPRTVVAAAGSFDQNPRIALVFIPLCVLLCVPLLYRIFICQEKLIFDRGFILMLLFLAVLMASTVFARDRTIASSELGDYLVEGLVLYFLVSNSIRDLATLRRATWSLLLAGSFMASFSVYQKASHTENSIYGGLAQIGSDFHSNPRMLNYAGRFSVANQVEDNGEVVGQLRAAGPIGEANRYGQILVVLLPLAALQFATEKAARLKALALLAAGLIFVGLLLTLSRGNLLAAVLAFALAGCLGLLKRRQIFGTLAGAALLIGIFQPGVIARMATLERLDAFLSESRNDAAPDSSAIRRYVENVAAWRVFVDHPLLGVGPGHFAAYYSNDYGNRLGLVEQMGNYRGHNLYLETLAETGVVGFSCFVAIYAAVVRGLWKQRRRWLQRDRQLALVATSFLVLLAAYAVSGIFDHLSYQRYFWLMLALAYAAMRIVRSQHGGESQAWGPMARHEFC
jgi:putative inorganic carbon (hco3(-)) transporter